MDPKKTKDRPFYELPENVQASSRIIQDARSSLRTVVTKRPFTPRDEKRTLFPASTARNPESRPASAFSLNSRHFDGSDSRPVSGTKLSPLDHFPEGSDVRARAEIKTPRAPTAAEIETAILAPKPPADPNRPLSRKGSRQKLYNATSVDGGGENVSSIRPRSGSTDGRLMHESSSPDREVPRRVSSGPKERTLPTEERGMADGKEAAPRVSSSMGVSSPPRTGGSHDGEQRVGSGSSRKSSSAGKTRSGSAGKRDSFDVGDDNLYTDKVAPVIDEMSALGKNRDNEKLGELAEDLYIVLDTNKKLTKSYKQRSSILKAIFKLLDVEEPRVMLKLARLILAFKVGGNNLLNVCKLVFKVSRNEKNDQEFLEGNVLDLLIETIRTTDHVASCEALIYCVGAIKFLTGNPTILRRLAKKECIETLAGLLHNIEKTNRDNGRVSDQFGHILVQLCAALRNLADVGSGRERFLQTGVIESLSHLLDAYPNDCDLVLYISRIFSKVTLHTDCCTVLANQHSCYKSFIHLLNRHVNKEDVVVRVCFVLGNITAKNDDARKRLFQEPNAMSTLLSVLKTFHNMESQKRSKSDNVTSNGRHTSSDGDGAINTVDDVLIKVVRVIANLSINDSVGPVIASHVECVQLLLSILDSKDIGSSEELILNTVATINNLSYYTTKTSAITAHQNTVAQVLLKLVMTDNMEAMLEASRVFGNLTRQRTVRDLLSKQKVDEIMITLLDSGNRELVFIACGVLINFMADEDKRPLLKKEGGIKKLTEVLRDFGREDWQLGSVVCKVLCNYSTKITSTNSCFGEAEAQDLIDVLVEYLDKETALEASLRDEVDEDLKDYLCETWEADFCPVASQLLKRIETYQSSFEPLEAPG
ncbi:armadillo repeat-containing protein 2-like isoform X1 [Haliotis asinina]|uniref:armadillo repeat-containing protein 2-like isoform X1 n=1 Tax=Haliotis asinina TaxID=109174 RepID=UPI0035324A1E